MQKNMVLRARKVSMDYSDGKDEETIAKRDEKFLKLYHALYQ